MQEIRTPNELLEQMKFKMKYGWIGIDESIHIENLKGFRQLYRTSSVEEVIKAGLGTCIESANLAKTWFDSIVIENKLYCH